jgi:hypothetical protein
MLLRQDPGASLVMDMLDAVNAFSAEKPDWEMRFSPVQTLRVRENRVGGRSSVG